MPNDLTISRQSQTISGSQVQAGQVILNPRSRSKLAMLVVSGAELANGQLGRLFTDQPNRRTDVLGFTLENGQPRLLAIPNDREYELVEQYGNIVVVD